MTRLTFGLLATLTGLVLLFTYHTSLAGPLPFPAPSTAASSISAVTTAKTTTKARAPKSAAPRAGAAKATHRTVAGDKVALKSGAIQVRIGVSGTKVTSVKASVTSAGHGVSKATHAAVAVLDKEALAAQSAKIAAVPGAPSVSDGFRRSLASALRRAGL